MTKTVKDRLNELLDAKDRENEELRDTIAELETKIRGSRTAWVLSHSITDDELLPVPRLELCYFVEDDEDIGRTFSVEYRLVLRDIEGNLFAHPFGLTRISGTSCTTIEQYAGNPVRASDLPVRDGPLACHDSALLGLPLYVVAPGRKPSLFDGRQFQYAHGRGLAHRREAKAAPLKIESSSHGPQR